MPGSRKLSLVPTVTQVRHGRAFIRLINFSPEDVYLEPRTRVGVMHHVMGINSDESRLNFYQGSSNEVHIRPTDKAVHGGEGRNQGKQVSIPVDLSDIECSIKEKDQLSKLLLNYAHLFVNDDDALGYTDRVKHQIHTVNDVPVNQPYRRIPPSEYQSVKNHIQKLLDKQIIRESYSPYASPIVVVKKESWIHASIRGLLKIKSENNERCLPTVKNCRVLGCNKRGKVFHNFGSSFWVPSGGNG